LAIFSETQSPRHALSVNKASSVRTSFRCRALKGIELGKVRGQRFNPMGGRSVSVPAHRSAIAEIVFMTLLADVNVQTFAREPYVLFLFA